MTVNSIQAMRITYPIGEDDADTKLIVIEMENSKAKQFIR